MIRNETTELENSGTNTQLNQVLSHLQIASPAKGNAMCQACGETIVEGDAVTLYLFRPAGKAGYTVGQCRCRDHGEDLTSLFTLGVSEIVVDGRIGQCRDHATQQAWPVLLSPSIRLVSTPDTTTGRANNESISTDTSWNHGEHLQERLTDNRSATHYASDPRSEQAEIKLGGGQ